MVYAKLLPGLSHVDAKPCWQPPTGAKTFAGLTIGEALLQVGRDAIVRDDPYFGRRGIVKKIIADAEHGFLVAVHVYAPKKDWRGLWVDMHKPPPAARKFLAPGRVEII